MKKEVEKTIKKYLPKKWSKKEIKLFIEPKTGLDLDAINKNINDPIRDFVLKGGKRLRPALFLTTLKLFGINHKKYLDIAFFIELIHNGTLIIDDLEDDAKLRRGEPTCHKIFGIDTAISAGILACFLPFKIIENSKNLNKKQKSEILNIYLEELINMQFGQGIDIYWHKNPRRVQLSEYLEMCRLKTGGLIRMVIRMACIIAKKDKRITNYFKKFAESIGIAFQIKDDVLDLVTDNKEFGKNFGNDISEGKISLPIIFALQNSNKEEQRRLIKILKLHTKNRNQIKEVINIIKKSGAIDKALDYANALVDKSWKDTENKLPKNKALKEFKEITYFLIRRNY